MTELTEAERAALAEFAFRLCPCHQGAACLRRAPFWEAVERVIDGRLAPLRALTDHESTEPCGEHGYDIANGCEECSVADALRWQAGRLRAALNSTADPEETR